MEEPSLIDLNQTDSEVSLHPGMLKIKLLNGF